MNSITVNTQSNQVTRKMKMKMKMKINSFIRPLICLGAVAAATTVRAGSHTWSGAVNYSWSNAGNWSAGGAPQYGEPNVVLIYPANAVRYASTNGTGNIAI